MNQIQEVMDAALYNMLSDRESNKGVYIKMNKRLKEDYDRAYKYYDDWFVRLKETHKDKPDIVNKVENLHEYLKSYKS